MIPQVETPKVTPDQGDDHPVQCGYCPETVVFLPTYIGGHALCFQPRTVPHTSALALAAGWLPGPHDINGHTRRVWAPAITYDWNTRRAARHFHILHVCRAQHRGAAA